MAFRKYFGSSFEDQREREFRGEFQALIRFYVVKFGGDGAGELRAI